MSLVYPLKAVIPSGALSRVSRVVIFIGANSGDNNCRQMDAGESLDNAPRLFQPTTMGLSMEDKKITKVCVDCKATFKTAKKNRVRCSKCAKCNSDSYLSRATMPSKLVWDINDTPWA